MFRYYSSTSHSWPTHLCWRKKVRFGDTLLRHVCHAGTANGRLRLALHMQRTMHSGRAPERLLAAAAPIVTVPGRGEKAPNESSCSTSSSFFFLAGAWRWTAT